MPRGKVVVDWVASNKAEDMTLTFRWREFGGPHVKPPERHGFGSALLKAVLGEATVAYAPEGLTYTVAIAPTNIIATESRPLRAMNRKSV